MPRSPKPLAPFSHFLISFQQHSRWFGLQLYLHQITFIPVFLVTVLLNQILSIVLCLLMFFRQVAKRMRPFLRWPVAGILIRWSSSYRARMIIFRKLCRTLAFQSVAMVLVAGFLFIFGVRLFFRIMDLLLDAILLLFLFLAVEVVTMHHILNQSLLRFM